MATSLHERMAHALEQTGVLDASLWLRKHSPRSTLAIVAFHRNDATSAADPFDPDVVDAEPAQLRRHLEVLARAGTPVDLQTLIRGLAGGTLPRNPFLVTFDDGYRSCRDVALPILREVGVPATFFIATGFPDAGRLYWWEQVAWALRNAGRTRCELRYPYPITVDVRFEGMRAVLDDVIKNTHGLEVGRFLDELRAGLEVAWSAELEAQLARSLIMGWEDIAALVAGGMDIGSHTRSHSVLETLDSAALRDELVGSRCDLEARLGTPIRALAYPVGRVPSAQVRAAVAEAGYQVAFTNDSGLNHVWPGPAGWMRPIDAYAIRRVAPDRSYSDALFLTQVAFPSLAY